VHIKGVKEMKPVAWIINGHLFEEYFKTSELDKIIPLYPSPRELSDEEIIEVFETPFQPNTTGGINDEVIAFARAILKKARQSD
jgi:hypothetical protein